MKEMNIQTNKMITTKDESNTDIKTIHQVKGLKKILNEVEKAADKTSSIFKGTGGTIARDILTLVFSPLAVIVVMLWAFKTIKRRIFKKKNPILNRLIVSRNWARNKFGDEKEPEIAL